MTQGLYSLTVIKTVPVSRNKTLGGIYKEGSVMLNIELTCIKQWEGIWHMTFGAGQKSPYSQSRVSAASATASLIGILKYTMTDKLLRLGEGGSCVNTLSVSLTFL